MRVDMSEDQEGVPLYIDAQVLDIDSCKPVEGVYVEAWRMFEMCYISHHSRL